MPRILVVLGCSKEKAEQRLPVKNLYQGTLFKLGLEYANSIGADVRVMSALHGIVGLDDVLDPYNLKMSRERTKIFKHERPKFAFELGRLYEHYDRIIIIAGRLYRDVFEHFMPDKIENFMCSEGIGATLKKLKGEIRKI